VDIPAPGGGVAVLNDCKYGYSFTGNVVELGLLRGPTTPDPVADMAMHAFTYAFYPHPGDAAAAGVARAAFEFNVPLRAVPERLHKGTLPAEWTGPSVADAPSVVIDWVKRAEDGDGLIVRMYESAGRAIPRACLKVGWPMASAELVDLMESNPAPVAIRSSALELPFGPFEIQTVRLRQSARPRSYTERLK
jgi:alpha-mannosidase